MLIEFSTNLIAFLIESNYIFNDLEAQIFITIFAERSGHNNATFRLQIHKIIHGCCSIYPPAKLATFLLYVINLSKNQRSKAECLDELADTLCEYGINIVLPKDLKVLAKWVGNADVSIRNAAVKFFIEVYKYLGDEKILALIGTTLDAKSKDMLV
jgi:hypothetical protein